MRMSSSVTAAATIDHLARGPAGGRRFVVNNHHHHRSHLQRQAQQKGRMALASVASIIAPKARVYRSLVWRGADRPQVGDHRRPLYSQVSLIFPQIDFFEKLLRSSVPREVCVEFQSIQFQFS